MCFSIQTRLGFLKTFMLTMSAPFPTFLGSVRREQGQPLYPGHAAGGRLSVLLISRGIGGLLNRPAALSARGPAKHGVSHSHSLGVRGSGGPEWGMATGPASLLTSVPVPPQPASLKIQSQNIPRPSWDSASLPKATLTAVQAGPRSPHPLVFPPGFPPWHFRGQVDLGGKFQVACDGVDQIKSLLRSALHPRNRDH